MDGVRAPPNRAVGRRACKRMRPGERYLTRAILWRMPLISPHGEPRGANLPPVPVKMPNGSIEQRKAVDCRAALEPCLLSAKFPGRRERLLNWSPATGI